ncbi:ABC transporter ATP-binding protein [Falsigemmobacter faecalis]|uniref:ABC transporter ATP-binding protein n=1 Tax=Falsigemmobacter faecalis TaxID=2488730 RepID=A0A3P3DDM7_9RHOB|nr:ABC transporter ATP-binding protein [Falsigemmobacter faecalis]RRH72393.1 ABC transporter ATP-binding protein [Falsigemmobacter faecalis]
MMPRAADVPIIEVEDLNVRFRTREGLLHVLENVSFSLRRGETMGMVGESGSGKSVSAYALTRLLPKTADVQAGTMRVAGLDYLSAPKADIEALRGKTISMIFQNARAALNPIRRIGDQIADVLHRHSGLTRKDAREAAVQALAEVKIPDPAARYKSYPFQLSGGMCQRVMIALALAARPEILIADEPTTGLDVTTQAAIMDLIREKAASERMTTLLITHDLALAADYCDRFVVMHAGHVVESGATGPIFARPAHPYTRRLLKATPDGTSALSDLEPIPGNLPDLRKATTLCRFAARCPHYAADICDVPQKLRPAAGAVWPAHHVACARAADLNAEAA